MTDLDDMQDVEAIDALFDYLKSCDSSDSILNTGRMLEACFFSLIYFGKLGDESLALLTAAAIEQARKRNAYEQATDILIKAKGTNQ